MKAIFRSIFFMPGVIIHELSHHIFCIIFSAKVIDVCYYNFKDSSGYVRHERPKHLYQDVLIAIAPFFLNTFLGSLVAYPTIIYKFSSDIPNIRFYRKLLLPIKNYFHHTKCLCLIFYYQVKFYLKT